MLTRNALLEQINVVREYLDKEFRDVPFLFAYDLEQVRNFLEQNSKTQPPPIMLQNPNGGQILNPKPRKQVIDDFVLFCFFAGNDFLPHLPSLDIHEGAISEMIRIYKESVANGAITGYLCNRGNCNLERCGVILQVRPLAANCQSSESSS